MVPMLQITSTISLATHNGCVGMARARVIVLAGQKKKIKFMQQK